MEIDYDPKLVEESGNYFDSVAQCILNKDFKIKRKPNKKICRDCDFIYYCKTNILVAE